MSSEESRNNNIGSCCMIDGVNDSITQQVQITETEELITTSLKEFTNEINRIPNDCPTKQAYIHGCCINPQWVLYDESFRLQFLRTEVYNVVAAVERFLRYWTNRTSLYDEPYWFTPYRQKDMSDNDYEALTWGYLQIVNGHERLYYINPANTPAIGRYNVDSLVRAIHYTNEQKLQTSTIAQRKGVVAIIDFHTIRWYDCKLMNRLSETFNNGFPSRTSMTCIINAPPGTGAFVTLIKQFVKYKLRPRFYVISSSKQCEQLLGLSLEKLHASLDHTKWIHERRLFEQQQQQPEKLHMDSSLTSSTNCIRKTIMLDRQMSSLSDSSSQQQHEQQQHEQQQQEAITKQTNATKSCLNKFTWAKQEQQQQKDAPQPILKCMTLLSGQIL